MIVEAVPGALRAIRVDDEDHRPIDVDLVDGDAGTLGESLTAAVASEDGPPEHLVLVVPGDLDQHRFTTLTEAAELAGLPDPSWLPEAVAFAGARLVTLAAGLPVVVVDARGDEPVVWRVRTTDDGVEIGTDGARELGTRLDALLTGVVHAKLAVVAPDIAEALRRRTDPVGRRDAAHLGRELREARRLMCSTDGEELVVTAGEAEVYLDRQEFTDLLEHALHDTADAAEGARPAQTIVVADEHTAVVDHLAGTWRATVVAATAGASSLNGAAALVLPRPHLVDDPSPTDDLPLLARTMRASHGTALVRVPRPVPVPSGPPRWAVPALTGLLALALVGAAAVLVTDDGAPPAADAGASVPATPVEPVGFDLPGAGR
ncbi:hypothetical protein GCM10023203_40840 [Actinomycetospora straminea]|uniref:Type VII secretion-associated protein (TIGR03931 family) n=2 Tax=Actinomycetospora straminea TaxID=663607 RepID=A0ABP9EQI9_9PSEU